MIRFEYTPEDRERFKRGYQQREEAIQRETMEILDSEQVRQHVDGSSESNSTEEVERPENEGRCSNCGR